MGVGSRTAGQDGMVEVCCRLGLRWVGCKEEKAHTDLTGPPSPHPNKRQSCRQQPPILVTTPAASRSCAHPELAAGWHGTNSAHSGGHGWPDGLSLHGCARQARSQRKALSPLKLPIHESVDVGI